MQTALFRAFFGGPRHHRDVQVLAVGGSVGLDREGLRAALDEGRCAGKVIPGGRLAARLGVDPVPAMFVAPGGAPLEEGRGSRAPGPMGERPCRGLAKVQGLPPGCPAPGRASGKATSWGAGCNGLDKGPAAR